MAAVTAQILGIAETAVLLLDPALKGTERAGVPMMWGQASHFESAFDSREAVEICRPTWQIHHQGFGVQESDLRCTAPAMPGLAPQRFKVAGFAGHQLMRWISAVIRGRLVHNQSTWTVGLQALRDDPQENTQHHD